MYVVRAIAIVHTQFVIEMWRAKEQNLAHMKPTTFPSKYSSWQPVLLLIPLAFACFALSPTAEAVCQQGCDLTSGNTFLGDDALINNTTGLGNVAIGAAALDFNTTGSFNTATGVGALFTNSTGADNTATGNNTLFANTTGVDNTASGAAALISNTTGNENTATGVGALQSNSSGSNNTAIGVQALVDNRTGDNNTAIGRNALLNNVGSQNVAVGYQAGRNLTTGSNNIDIGNKGIAGESDTIRIGKSQTTTVIAGISGVTVADGVTVVVGADGHLGTVPCSARFKEAIKPMDKASEAILALKPMTFRYKHELDPAGVPQFGLVAEEVEKVNPDLVARDDQGKPYTVRYEAVNAMLLNEFLKEHKTVQEQGTVIARQQKQIEALTAGLQKVNAQLQLSKSVLQTVSSDH